MKTTLARQLFFLASISIGTVPLAVSANEDIKKVDSDNLNVVINDIGKKTKEFMDNADSHLSEEDKKLTQPVLSDEYLSIAKKLFSASKDIANSQMGAAGEIVGYDLEAIKKDARDEKTQVPKHGPWIDVLVSESLGDGDLSLIMKELAYSTIPVRVVFRGIREDESINAAFSRYALLNHKLGNQIPAIIDPNVFSENNTNVVPRMIYNDKDSNVVAFVDGLTNTEWLKEQVDLGKTGNLGVKGPVEDILERNLIDVMKERMAKIDLEERKKQTVKTYWERAEFTTLVRATKDRSRLIDPTVIVNEDITDGQGNIITPAGARINPLSVLPFSRRLITFNPNIEAEVEWAKSLPPSRDVRDIYIITELNRYDGWKHLESLQELFNTNIFMLKRDVSDRFQLQKTPSIVTSKGLYFLVKEFDLTNTENAQ